MTPFRALLDTFAETDEGWSIDAPDDWRQGRTLYGGLSAALCFAACARHAPGLPPLRSAQIAFCGPSAGPATLKAAILRQGKSATFMGCDLIAQGTVATRALFVFGGERAAADIPAPAAPAVPQPQNCEPVFGSFKPTFAQHFDLRLAGGAAPLSGSGTGSLTAWVKPQDAEADDTLASLVLLADALPPAAMSRMSSAAAISTVSWQFDVIAPGLYAAGRPMILDSTEQGAADGYSFQSMAMWNEDGKPVLLGRQCIAVFA